MKSFNWVRWMAVGVVTLAALSAPAEVPASGATTDGAAAVTTESKAGDEVRELKPMTVRGRRLESPRGASLRLRVVSGRDVDRLDRSVLREAPRVAAMRERRVVGVTWEDRVDRGVFDRSPRGEANFPL